MKTLPISLKDTDVARFWSKVDKHKLTTEQVFLIKRLCKEGVSQRKIGRRFGIAQSHVGRIMRNEAWSHLNTEPSTENQDPRTVTRRAPHPSGGLQDESGPAPF